MKRPMAHIGFSVGITLIVLNLIQFKYIPIIIIGLAALFTASLVLSKFRKAMSLPLCIGGAILGCLIFASTISANVQPQLALDDKTCDVQLYIVDLPRQTDSNYIYTVKSKSIDCENAPQNIKFELKSKNKIDAKSYQLINAKIKFSKNFDNAFDSYGRWADDIYLKAKVLDYDIKNEFVKSPNSKILDIRQDIISKINNTINNDSGGLATALLIGDKSNLSNKAYNNFKLSGVTHIMAVSGMHLAVLSSFFVFILTKLGVNNRNRAIIIIPMILFYISLAGFSKSVIRAGILMIVMLIGELFDRKSDSLNSLGLAIIILCLNPFSVCDIGAVLSVLSTLALITLYPLLNNKAMNYKIFNKPIIRGIVRSIIISLSVMLYTLPVMYIAFGYVSISSIISNIVLVPIGSVAMIFSLLMYLSSFVPFVYPIFTFLTNAVCTLMLNIVGWLSDLPYAIMPLNEDLYIVITCAFIIIGIAFITNKKKNIKLSVILSIVIVVATMFSPYSFIDNSSKVLICKNNAVLIQSSNKALIYGLDNYNDYTTIKSYIFKNNLNCDTIVLSKNFDDNRYNIELAQQFGVDNIVSFGDYNSLYEMPRTDVVDGRNARFYFDNSVCINILDKNGSYYNVKINGFTVTNSKYSIGDIEILNNYIQDCNGYIDLSQSNVVYCLNEDNTFTVRRVD